MPDTQTDYTFMVVACTRLVVSALGFFLIFYFKVSHGIARFREQAKGGLPVDASYKTAIGIALLVVNAVRSAVGRHLRHMKPSRTTLPSFVCSQLRVCG
jgi:hypothetical protein